jgi:hypothetical protein
VGRRSGCLDQSAEQERRNRMLHEIISVMDAGIAILTAGDRACG